MRLTSATRAALIIIGVILFASTVVNLGRKLPGSGGGKVVFEDKSSSSLSAKERIYVSVTGAVKKPGVCSLKHGSRVFHVLKAAGGASANADLTHFNLAAAVEDGSLIHVPAIGETPSAYPESTAVAAQSYYNAEHTAPAPPSQTKSSTSNKLKTPGEGYVNINTAGATELERLPGVGKVTANAILDYRNRIGRFTSPEQLISVKGIGPKKMEQMRPFVRCQ